LPKAFESSAGFRFLQFRKENALNNNIFILALTAGKYYKNWWFSLRSYTTPKTKSVSQSVHFLTRLYLSNADNYIGFGFGAGSSPDEIRNQSNNTFENLRLKSYNLKFEMQHLLGNRLVFKVSGGYVVEEYEFELFRNSYNVALGFSFYL